MIRSLALVLVVACGSRADEELAAKRAAIDEAQAIARRQAEQLRAVP